MSSSTSYPSSLDGTSFHEEGRMEKFLRKLRQEPLIPFGCALTCWALYNASKSIRSGDHHKTNRMFRARIYAQAFTLVCMIGGSVYYADERAKRKDFENAVDEKRAKEKQQAWIRELEARDEEEKELRAKRTAIVEARAQAKREGREPVGSARSMPVGGRGGVFEAVRYLRW